MSKKPSLVQINAQLYDASTGRLFHHPRGPVIDGFMRKPQSGRVIKSVANALTPAARRHKPAQTMHKRAQRAKTLMRSVVKKPNSGNVLSNRLKIAKLRSAVPSEVRLSRALKAVKNSRVERFGNPIKQSHTMLTSAAYKAKPLLSSNSTDTRSTSSTTVAIRSMPSLVTSVSHQRLERMLDKALFQADAHKQALREQLSGQHRLRRRFKFLPRWLTITLAVLVVASAGAYFAWHNIPYVSMKFASLRAQVKGSLPDYIPSGFKFAGPVKYDNNSLSMTFKGEDDGRYFTLTQQASNWDSSSLEANTVAASSQVQTSQVNGKTVYIYDNNRAAWVDGGSLYTLVDNANLSSNQILDLVKSIN